MVQYKYAYAHHMVSSLLTIHTAQCAQAMSMASRLEVERLIGEVEKRPILWNVKLKAYKDVIKKQLLWTEVADTLGIQEHLFRAVDAAQKKWKSIRDNFWKKFQEIRKKKRSGASFEECEVYPEDDTWPYFGQLFFLKDVCTTRRYFLCTPLSI
ncbi:transcription factor Adf-1-like [Ornithodoros turicata]|uniref:transcription factor Adf-1-like n=1 Tax=Ornithodoros turicata TaxID=34597 RepID=UPI003139BEFD